LVLAQRPDWIHIDSYWPEADLLSKLNLPSSNMQDGEFGVRASTIGVDSNLDSEMTFEAPELSQVHMAGADSVLIREQVLTERKQCVEEIRSVASSVLVVLGGNDPHGMTL